MTTPNTDMEVGMSPKAQSKVRPLTSIDTPSTRRHTVMDMINKIGDQKGAPFGCSTG